MNYKTYAERENFNRVKVIVSPVGRQGPQGPKGDKGEPTDISGIYSNFPFNNIQFGDRPNPIITKGEAGEFDDGSIGELGNTIYDEVLGKYILVYTGRKPSHGGVLVHIGMATSIDGIIWEKQGQIIDTPSEDPYIIKKEDVFYLYVEKKEPSEDFPDGEHAGVELHTSYDLITWENKGLVLERGQEGTWDSQDVSSPLVYEEKGNWYMFFEGRSPEQTGALGVATSTDGINWVKNGNNPLMTGTDMTGEIAWGRNIIPDDLIKIGDIYLMSAHIMTNYGYVTGLLTSQNLINWEDYLGAFVTHDLHSSHQTGAGTYFFSKDQHLSSYNVLGGDVYKGNFNIRAQDSWQIIKVNYSLHQWRAVRGLRMNEVFLLGGDFLRIFEIGGISSAVVGVQKIIKNLSTSQAVRLRPLEGITISGSEDDIDISPGQGYWLILTSENNWDIIQTFNT